MDDLGARLQLQQRFGEQADDVVALDEAALLVEQENPVGGRGVLDIPQLLDVVQQALMMDEGIYAKRG